ncbi:hypothetical protein PsorP6_003008 [Peronosclerospora sorghi]|uniref:Uncharacterized protein n=1 Tax=Peronosclerospora sorghi TaxID=230839 RepID=A0ACC0VQB0_9STRA|nr:hypothetical protein PsorP6_003008 [Peronosclerospora sorghi]
MKLFFDMVKAMERGYEEAILKEGSNVLRDLVKKPEFTLVKRNFAWKAMRLANLQPLMLELHRRVEAVEFDKTTITQGNGIFSAKSFDLKGLPRNNGRFKSDSKDPLVHTQRLPPSTAPSALTGIRLSARRVDSALETQDVAYLTSLIAAGPASSLPNSLSTSCGTKRSASSSYPPTFSPHPPKSAPEGTSAKTLTMHENGAGEVAGESN